MNRTFLRVGAFLPVLFIASTASAHVVVQPAEVGVAAYQTFTLGAPNEKDGTPTTSIRLVIPAGLKGVTPNVKPGWTIAEDKTGTGEAASVTQITWSGGSIPSGQRDEFSFSAQAPAKAADLDWKAYQTFGDGSVTSWDQAPTGADDESVTPYSVTKVVSDLGSSNTANSRSNHDPIAIGLAVVAVVMAGIGLLRKRA